MKLYEISDDYKALQEMEVDEAVTETLDMIEGEFNDKANNILALIANRDGDVAALDAQIKRLTDMKKAIVNRQESLKDYLRENMARTGISKIECPLFKVTLSKSQPVVVVEDSDSIPDDYMNVKTVITPDKNAIKAALKEGKEIKGARLEDGKPRLLIK